jgi:hypothetical protein
MKNAPSLLSEKPTSFGAEVADTVMSAKIRILR